MTACKLAVRCLTLSLANLLPGFLKQRARIVSTVFAGVCFSGSQFFSNQKETAMQTISEVMTRNVQSISPRETLRRAAQMMDELNVGALPVCDGDKLVGMVTDRDLTVRATSADIGPGDAVVDDVMSTDVQWCFEDQPLDEVMKKMADTQIRRVPVVSHDDAKKLIGIVSLGDLATKTEGGGREQNLAQTVQQVSTPSEPDLSTQGKANTNRQQGDVEVRHTSSSGSDSSTGETGAPAGTDAAGASGASGGVAGTKSSLT
jgi:CBS domain-containing protein